MEVYDEPLVAAKQAAEEAAKRIQLAINTTGQARVIFSTGASQFELMEALTARTDIPWEAVTCFHLDEYLGLNDSHPASFRRYLRERLVQKLPRPVAAFHFIETNGSISAECARLTRLLRERPIDLAFIGIGENAHLAFNDPPADFATSAAFHVVTLDEDCRKQQLGEGWFGHLNEVPAQAISMTVPEILKSQRIVCCVTGKRKATALKLTVEYPVTPNVPASILQNHNATTLYLDQLSASLLESQCARRFSQ